MQKQANIGDSVIYHTMTGFDAAAIVTGTKHQATPQAANLTDDSHVQLQIFLPPGLDRDSNWVAPVGGFPMDLQDGTPGTWRFKWSQIV
jgi:hypothetical protein